MELRTAPITGVWARIRISLFVDSGRGNTRFLFQTRILSFRAERSAVENGAAAESRHRREGRRLSEWEVSESSLSIYPSCNKAKPRSWVQSIDQADFSSLATFSRDSRAIASRTSR